MHERTSYLLTAAAHVERAIANHTSRGPILTEEYSLAKSEIERHTLATEAGAALGEVERLMTALAYIRRGLQVEQVRELQQRES